MESKHPSYGKIQVSHRQTNSGYLFGSQINNHTIIVLTISNACLKEDGINDNIFAEERCIEIEMSPVQWAEMLTSMNTTGVPCTIRWQKGIGVIEYEPPFKTRLETLQEEFEASYAKDLVNTPIEQLIAEVKNLKISKKKKSELINKLNFIKSRAKSRADFHLTRVKEKTEKIVTEGKASIKAFKEHTVKSLGFKKLEEIQKLLK